MIHSMRRMATAALGALVMAVGVASAPPVQAQVVPPHPPPVVPGPLSSIPVPEPANLGAFVKDKAAAIRLGKALYWDMQMGSDGVVACATCHFHAGADSRVKNQLNPGQRGIPSDNIFSPFGGPNHVLSLGEYPFHQLADVNDANSPVLADRNDIAGSQGVFLNLFSDITPGLSREIGIPEADSVFQVGGLNVRRTTPRNTPTVINAVFNYRNFWDGRAQNEFNGVNPFGTRDPNARVFMATGANTVQTVSIELENASLASQAVGPPGSDVETSFTGRPFPKIGKKLCALMALAGQWVSPQDSVLGVIARSGLNPAYKGLTKRYPQMIREAFQPQWWNASNVITWDSSGQPHIQPAPYRMLTTSEYTLMEANFSLFFGLAIQCYEATLVSDQTPADKFFGGDMTALNAQEQLGLQLFMTKGNCMACHGGSELTNASVRNISTGRDGLPPLHLERMIMGDGQEAVYDNGFYNIGVRPTLEDIGIGGTDPFGQPLSDSGMALLGLFVDPNLNPPVVPFGNERIAVRGNFKTCQLRNVELTGPYFHNGGQATLMQVVEFYNRGGDFARQNLHDLDFDLLPLGLTLEEKQALVAFLKALTDPRVRYEQAPFDHPQLFVANGEVGNESSVVNDGTGKAKDNLVEVRAVGAAGGRGIGPTFPQ